MQTHVCVPYLWKQPWRIWISNIANVWVHQGLTHSSWPSFRSYIMLVFPIHREITLSCKGLRLEFTFFLTVHIFPDSAYFTQKTLFQQIHKMERNWASKPSTSTSLSSSVSSACPYHSSIPIGQQTAPPISTSLRTESLNHHSSSSLTTSHHESQYFRNQSVNLMQKVWGSGARKTAQWLRTFAATAEDQGSVPSEWLSLVNPAPRDPMPSSGFCEQ